MSAMIILAIAQAVATPLPMNNETWRTLDRTSKVHYADATIQGLRRNPVIARCQALTPDVLAAGVDREARAGEPLMMAVAKAAYAVCP